MIHCQNSKERTGEDFRELHEWMDKPGEVLGIDHRRVRHDLSYLEEVKEKFGVPGVREFLRHIAEDYLHTAKKWDNKICATKGCDKPTWQENNYCGSCYNKWKRKNDLQ